MFDIGFWELSVIGVIGLLVLGPERLPGVARVVGGYVRKARSTWANVRSEIAAELAADEFKEAMRKPAEEFKAAMDEPMKEVQSLKDAARQTVSADGSSAESANAQADAATPSETGEQPPADADKGP